LPEQEVKGKACDAEGEEGESVRSGILTPTGERIGRVKGC
jgi:hypothetical protein